MSGPEGAVSAVTSNARESRAGGVTVYNMEIEGSHTYFVRAEGAEGGPVWVHNAEGYLADLEYGTPGDYLVDSAKPSVRGRILKTGIRPREIETHVYENPGTHDPSTLEYTRNRAVLPTNQTELFENSIPFEHPYGSVTRWAIEDGVFHRFQGSNEVYHWNGSTNGVTRDGISRVITDVPVEIRQIVTGGR